VSNPASHYDTTRLPRVEWSAAEIHAKRQEDRVLAFFRAFPNTDFTREGIEATFDLPTQSASRVLANLTARFAIEKSATATETSRYGRRAHTWRLARPVESPVIQGRLL